MMAKINMRIKYYYTNKIVLFYFEDRDHYYYDLVNEIFDFLLNKRENERLDLFFVIYQMVIIMSIQITFYIQQKVFFFSIFAIIFFFSNKICFAFVRFVLFWLLSWWWYFSSRWWHRKRTFPCLSRLIKKTTITLTNETKNFIVVFFSSCFSFEDQSKKNCSFFRWYDHCDLLISNFIFSVTLIPTSELFP